MRGAKRMNTYIIYFARRGECESEKMAKVTAASPEKAIEEFYKIYDSRFFEATGYEKILI